MSETNETIPGVYGHPLGCGCQGCAIIRRNARRVEAKRIADRAFLNPQELATVLAALRVFQHVQDKLGGLVRGLPPLRELDHFADVKPLTDGQINSLCERLNTEGLAS